MLPSSWGLLRSLRPSSTLPVRKLRLSSLVNDANFRHLRDHSSLRYQQASSIAVHNPLPSYCGVAAMARKQKAAPTLRADTPPSSVASPAAPSAKTRRSSRRISSKPEYAETGTEDEDAVDTPNGGDNMLKDAAQLSITGRARPMLRRKSSALKRDIRALGELDDKLHGHSKRQRNMIDGGGRTPDAGKDGKQGSGAEGIIPAKLSRASAPRRDSPSVRKRTKEHVSLPNVPRDISGGEETEAGDDAYAPIDDDLMVGDRTCLEVSERGAARPPAVNSSYLPLPWKGRLGYVSTFEPTWGRAVC